MANVLVRHIYAGGVNVTSTCLEADSDVIPNIPDIHGVATDRVDIIGRNLASAANDGECMLGPNVVRYFSHILARGIRIDAPREGGTDGDYQDSQRAAQAW